MWNKEKLLKSCHEWRGTPHRDRLRLKGAGVDCVNFVAAVAIENGIAEDFRIPYYDPSWGVGRKNNVIERILTQCFHIRKLEDDEAKQDGDILIFRVGSQSNHIGIVADNECWHCMTRRAVEPCVLDCKLLKDIQSVLRFEKTGFKKRPEELVIEDFRE